MSAGNNLLTLLQMAVQNRVSDIHFRAGLAPAFRTRDGVVNANFPVFSDQDMIDLCNSIIKDQDVKAKLDTLLDFDGSFEVPKLARFRFNIFRNLGRLGAILRIIPNVVPSIKQLGLPPTLEKIAELNRGLILVTGATGSGKSSTLAAMINHINESEACHILTIEDPVEFVHQTKKSRITQREAGRDTTNFSTALRSALRQDPDVILVGELRDVETLDIALKAAETGHLVFSTVHTTDAIKTIGRLVAMYPPEQQRMARLRLAENLEATISQRLVPCDDGKSRVVAMEIMRANLAVRECIANEDKTSDMNGCIEKAYETLGTQTFDMHLARLVKEGIISHQTAMDAASNSADFERSMTFGESQLAKRTDVAAEPEQELVIENYDQPVIEKTEPTKPVTIEKATKPKIPPIPKMSA
jgi:twitching motility protein PilT